jgi:hypothetical protein
MGNVMREIRPCDRSGSLLASGPSSFVIVGGRTFVERHGHRRGSFEPAKQPSHRNVTDGTPSSLLNLK